jgi:hypothetical protein
MDTILNQAQMLQRFPRPKIVGLSDRKKAYNRIADNIGTYESEMKNGSLTPQSQKTVLGAISEDCGVWLLEDKGKHRQQYNYVGSLRKMVDKILENQNKPFCKSAKLWYAQRWAWNKAVAYQTKSFCQEPFEFYEAVQKWIKLMYHSRQGAWYLLTNHLKTANQVDVGLEEGTMNPRLILGVPSTSINVPFAMYQRMADLIRRAHPTMFDEAIEFMEGSTMWQRIEFDPYFKAISAHIRAEVSGPG